MSDQVAYSKMTKDQLIDRVEQLTKQITVLETELSVYTGDQTGRKLDMEKALLIRQMFADGASKNSLALKFRVSRDSIQAVLKNQIYKPIDPKEVAAREAEKLAKEAAKVARTEARAKAKADKEANAEAAKIALAEKKAAQAAAVKAKAEKPTSGAVADAKKAPKSKNVTVKNSPKTVAKVPAKTAPVKPTVDPVELRKQAMERAQQKVAAAAKAKQEAAK